VDVQGSFADVQGSSADVQGSFADVQGSVADIRIYRALLLIHRACCLSKCHLQRKSPSHQCQPLSYIYRAAIFIYIESLCLYI